MSKSVTGHRRAIGTPKKAKSTGWGHTGRDLYFIRENGTDGYIKIGRTDNVDRRLAQLQSGNARRLRVVRVLSGAGPDEAQWHSRFSNERFAGGEWFRASERLLTAIQTGRLSSPTKSERRRSQQVATRKKQIYAGRRLVS